MEPDYFFTTASGGGAVKKQIRKALIIVIDFLFINFSTLTAIILKNDFLISETLVYRYEFLIGIPVLTASFFLTQWLFGCDRILWQFAGARDRTEFGAAVFLSNIPYMTAHILLTGGYSVSVYIISAVFMTFALLIVRTAIKVIYKLRTRKKGEKVFGKNRRRVMIVGAGDAGNMLLHDIENSPSMTEYRAVCFIDDDKTKIGRRLGRVLVAGSTATIAKNVKKYEVSVIIFAIPSCPPDDRARILHLCSATGCQVKTLPSLSQMVNGRVTMRSVRDIQVEDLLGRQPVKLGLESVKSFIAGKTVMVTGGGGSIGSELCRQIATYGPGRLIIFDAYENNAYDIQNELRRSHKELDLLTLIGSVRDTRRIEQVISDYRPDVIYHAAAHKHVPLMEDSPEEAIKNNVFGTLNTVRAADKFGVGRFIMISTDKAVNPTNVMGATKRICEMIIQSYAKKSRTEFAAVRFGNVLGSNGSVIPLFKKQIEEGGPVTVTHEEINRFFMTIPEAVSLVLEAGVKAKGGEIFVLDMGKPVRILELAENLIRLSGHVPYEDIDIEITGLRPGEKLFEEMMMDEEGLSKTSHELIFVGKPIAFDEENFNRKLAKLWENLESGGSDIRELIHGIVPTYVIPETKVT